MFKVNAKTLVGTPLHLACKKNNVAFAKLLLELKADLE